MDDCAAFQRASQVGLRCLGAQVHMCRRQKPRDFGRFASRRRQAIREGGEHSRRVVGGDRDVAHSVGRRSHGRDAAVASLRMPYRSAMYCPDSGSTSAANGRYTSGPCGTTTSRVAFRRTPLAASGLMRMSCSAPSTGAPRRYRRAVEAGRAQAEFASRVMRLARSCSEPSVPTTSGRKRGLRSSSTKYSSKTSPGRRLP